ncbi:MAG: hypothetical protein FJ150_06740 [Euryarchaeota archaeon]|nr:hypothetical protein [Euryarchaeota archaeon]
MAETQVLTGYLIYSHVIPAVLGFLGVLLICTGIMDRKLVLTVLGIVLFFSAGILPFLILPAILGV